MSDKCLRWIDTHLGALLLALFVLRAAFLPLSGLDLIGDESYYWDWSRQPAWCYYSKPPMVAWLIGAFTWLLGDSTAMVRFPAVVLGTVFLWFFHATAKAFYGARAAALALLLILATPIEVVANFLMTIDPPLYCFWMMSLYYLRRALFDGDGKAWLQAGCATAAALLSKQVAVALPVMLLVFLLWDKDRRGLLKREFFYYLAPVMLVAVPILWWNWQHDWVMFGHSKSHFGNPEPSTLLKHLQQAGDFLLYQGLLISPLLFGMAVIVSVLAVLEFRRSSPEQQFLVLMGPVLLLGILLLSFLQKVQGNWPMPFYFTALLLLAGRCSAGLWKTALKAGLALGYFLVVATYLLPVLIQAFNLQHTAFDPTKRFKDWRDLAGGIHYRRLMSLPNLEDSFVVAFGHRYLASQLAFYLPDHPKVYRFETSGQVTSQYEVWPGPAAFIGKNGFVVASGGEASLPEGLVKAFERFRFVAEVQNPSNAAMPYRVYLGENLRAWPEPVASHTLKESHASSEN